MTTIFRSPTDGRIYSDVNQLVYGKPSVLVRMSPTEYPYGKTLVSPDNQFYFSISGEFPLSNVVPKYYENIRRILTVCLLANSTTYTFISGEDIGIPDIEFERTFGISPGLIIAGTNKLSIMLSMRSMPGEQMGAISEISKTISDAVKAIYGDHSGSENTPEKKRRRLISFCSSHAPTAIGSGENLVLGAWISTGGNVDTIYDLVNDIDPNTSSEYRVFDPATLDDFVVGE